MQVYPLLNESSADMIIGQIKEQFNVRLAEVDHQYNDGISLEPLADEDIFISDKFENLGMPAAYVLFGNMAFNYTNNQNYLEASNELVIVLTAEDVGADILTRKLWRYARVIYSCFNLVDLVSTDSRLHIKCIPKRLGYSDVKVTGKMQERERKFRQDCVLELELMHFEKNIENI